MAFKAKTEDGVSIGGCDVGGGSKTGNSGVLGGVGSGVSEPEPPHATASISNSVTTADRLPALKLSTP